MKQNGGGGGVSKPKMSLFSWHKLNGIEDHFKLPKGSFFLGDENF